jgi:hypothetical protein
MASLLLLEVDRRRRHHGLVRRLRGEVREILGTLGDARGEQVLFLREGLERAAVGFVAGSPELATERGVVVVERRRSAEPRGVDQAHLIEARAADAQGREHAPEAQELIERGRPELRHHVRDRAVHHVVPGVVRSCFAGNGELGHRPRELVRERLPNRRIVTHGRRTCTDLGLRLARAEHGQRRKRQQFPAPHGGLPGGDNTGGLSLSLSRNATSRRCTSKLGLIAETGTQPDSAPQEPLNTS